MKKPIKYYTKTIRFNEQEMDIVSKISLSLGGMVSFSDIVRASLALYWKYLLMGGNNNENHKEISD